MIFASNNAHKLSEVRSILAPRPVLSLSDIGFVGEIEETGTTLEANSLIKAHAVVDWLAEKGQEDWVFADDTGLEIEALGGEPGVRTARWAGEPACDANNRKKALEELKDQTNRRARFRTVITLMKGKEMYQVEGIVNGRIEREERGDHGFGYDQLFVPEGYEETFAQLPEAVKNSISHRARALQALLIKLNSL